jgi:hypothetical protein
MARSDRAGQQIERQPPPRALERRLGPSLRGTERGAAILGLDQTGTRCHLADGPHCHDRGAHLRQQRPDESTVVGSVRIPVSVEAAEPRRRQRLVDRREVLDPRVPARHRRGELGQAGRERVIDERGVARTAAVMDETDDRADVELAQPAEPLVAPPPVDLVDAVRAETLPQHRVSQRANAERGEQLEVLRPAIVTRADQLIEPAIRHAVDRAFDTAPHLERGAGVAVFGHALASSRLGTPLIFE